MVARRGVPACAQICGVRQRYTLASQQCQMPFSKVEVNRAAARRHAAFLRTCSIAESSITSFSGGAPPNSTSGSSTRTSGSMPRP